MTKNILKTKAQLDEFVQKIGVKSEFKKGATIELNGIFKKYQGNADYTLENINLKINSGEFVVFLGPSGCGKTTLLRMIAGLSSITKGDLLFNGKKYNNLSPSERDVAMVFQSYALYPHMNVYKNMAFGLTLQRERKDIIDRRIKDSAKILQIDSLLYKKPSDLSGGQRQRVAIGRAIVRKPSVFLMDEPLSNLDAKLRESMRREIAELHRFLNTTSIYVTHDQLEAMTMADRIVVFHDGAIQQNGRPKELYFKPEKLFVARFIGSPTMNLYETKYSSRTISIPEIGLKINPTKGQINELKNGMDITIGFRTENIFISKKKQSGYVEAIVQNVEVLGKDQLVLVKTKNSTTKITTTNYEEFEYGQRVYLKMDSKQIHIFNTKTGKRIG